MAKALTNGALPMGAVAVSEKIYHTVTSSALDGAVEFFHGYTYSAHPAACAAGIAALDIYEKEGLFERAAEMSPYFLDRMYSLQGIKAVTDIRGYGMLCGIDLAPAARPGLRGFDATKRLVCQGPAYQVHGRCRHLRARPGRHKKLISTKFGVSSRTCSANIDVPDTARSRTIP